MSYGYPSQVLFLPTVWGNPTRIGILLDMSLPDVEYARVVAPQSFPTWGMFNGVQVQGPTFVVKDQAVAYATFAQIAPVTANNVIEAWRAQMISNLATALGDIRALGSAVVSISPGEYRAF